MIDLVELDSPDAPGAAQATQVLEAGGLIVFPRLPFDLAAHEHRFLDPAVLSKSKTVSLDPVTGRLSGTCLDEGSAAQLKVMVHRFSDRADALLRQVTPHYAGALQKRRTSFRPAVVSNHPLSPRKDDRRLHVDAFPSSPVQGRRILRVFANVNLADEARIWDVGEEDFEGFARRFPARPPRTRGEAWMLERLGITRGRRTAYDQAMLRLHDAAKLDDRYQAAAARRRVAFPAGSMWIVYTDSVLHAAISGQHALEQTYLLAPDAMVDERLAPVRVLERLTGRPLI